MKLHGNTILITGGATGIGFALAEAFVQAGNTVIVCGRRESKLVEAQSKLPGLKIKVCDVSDARQQEDLVRWVTAEYPEINMLINNAGIQRDIDLKKGTEELTSGGNELKVNLEAPIWLSSLFIPYFQKQQAAAIVNVTSGIAFIPSVKAPIYSVTKAALHTFSIVLRHQLKSTPVKVFEVIPPLILDTELNVEGRAKARAAAGNVPDHIRFAHMKVPTSAEFAEAVLAKMAADVYEIGYGTSEASLTASKQELEKIFQQMNP